MKKKTIIPVLILFAAFSSFVFYLRSINMPAELHSMNDVTYSSKINDNRFQVLKNGEWEDIVIKGVNIGMAKPGTWPGEAAITEEEYYRWFEKIGEMNANTVRTYTIHPPHFYKALKKYNERHKDKLYLFQGVWIDEEPLEETLDAFDQEIISSFKKEITRAIDVIHGNITIVQRPGHASGHYEADVSPYVIGWILGIEWFPEMVDNVNHTRLDSGEFNGEFTYTEGANPFEHWLADIMDHTLSYEMDQYRWQRPISFTNWVSTDMLDQTYEPFEQEDLASINPNVIKFKNIEPNYFASYHIYPYYPDFLNYDPKYTEYIDRQGKENNYAGYIDELISAHEIPVLIAEFGIPSSRGKTHNNVHGWNQGFMSEKAQGEVVANLFEDMIYADYMGGLVFSWQDEWFKRTWNTMDVDNPDRRPYWSNAQTSEQQFGLLSFDRNKIRIDGNKKDWKKNKTSPIYEVSNKNTDKIKAVYMDHDERYVYFGVDYRANLTELETLIFLDTNPDQGNTTNPFNPNITTDSGTDFVIHIKNKEDSKIYVDSYYDVHYYQYGKLLDMIPLNKDYEMHNSGNFNSIKLALNKGITIPATGEEIPFEDYETGILRYGNGNPESKDFDSLADYYTNEKNDFLEIRIPWALLGFTDPSTNEIMGDIYKNGLESRKNIKGFSMAIATFEPEAPENFDSFPRLNKGKLLKDDMYTHHWDEWNNPIIQERLKDSYYILQNTFKKY